MARAITLVCLWLSLMPHHVKSQCKDEGNSRNCSFLELRAIPDFTDLTVSVLDMSYNKISTVSLLNVSDDATLTFLNLSHNLISAIYNSSFQKLRHLEVLDLSNNVLKGEDLYTKVFDELENLKVLILERNPLKMVRRGTFDFFNLLAMENLDLSHCDIHNLEERAIDLPRLIHLDLSWNRLQSLNPDALKMMTRLETLDLSHNDLSEISVLPFLPVLKTLILDNNVLINVDIREAVFKSADDVRVISLRNNKIRTLEQDKLPWDLEVISQIDLTNNPIECDCKLKWIINDENIAKKNVTILCMYPDNLRGINLMKLSENELVCRPPILEILLATGASVVAVATMIGIVFCILALRRKRIRTKTCKDGGGNYTAIYSRGDGEETHMVNISDEKILLRDRGKEFDV
ncbi:hypothetical protein CHS0354_016153 [Potamilus streckersoni]|uniref:Uncharacterized protein n=1 Tax=Potamilus streckersoni TaxID=2493646 RepID=A0AAE0SQE0_9BIVA|nr:hypothetical protein CHS0354_016153 [Potamilus streckersoni]